MKPTASSARGDELAIAFLASAAAAPPISPWATALAVALVVSGLGQASRTAAQGTETAPEPAQRLWSELHPLATPATLDHGSAPDLPAVDGTLDLDGRLDEPFWRDAMIWDLGLERRAKLNAPATQSTLFLAAATADELRFAFLALDDRVDKLRAPLSDRLSTNPIGDYVWVGLAPLGDERSVYFVYVNPRNVQADSFYEDGGAEDHRFDFPWESAAEIGIAHWSVEIRVPFRHLRFVGGVPWRLAAARRQTREFSYFFWPLPFDPDRSCFVCQYPAVRVATPPERGQVGQVIPFVVATSATGDERGDRDQATAGVDIKWQPTPGWIVDAALSPDFSQVESDEVQLTNNLRFAPFLAERRPFFLERSDLFTTPLNVAYTRSILDPDYGLRATGRRGRDTFALLSVKDAASLLSFPGPLGERRVVLDDLDSQVFFASVRRDLGRSKLGLLATDRRYDGGGNSLLSVDGRFPLGKTWVLQLQGIGSRTQYPDRIAEDFDQPRGAFSGFGGWGRLEHAGREWTHRWTLEALDQDLRSDTGFLQRVDYQRLTVTEWWHRWVEGRLLRDHGVFVEAHATRHDGRTLDWEVWVGGDCTLLGETYLDVGYVQGEDSVASGDLLPYRRVLFLFSTSPSRWLAFNGSASVGTAIDYALEREVDQLSVRFAPQLQLFERLTLASVTRWYHLSERSLLQKQFVQDLRADLQVTPRLGFRQIAQLSESSHPEALYRSLGLAERDRSEAYQSLLRYRIDYGTAAFLGLYQRRTERTGAPPERDRGLFLKVSYLWSP